VCIIYRRIQDYANLADGRGKKRILIVFEYYGRVLPKGQEKQDKTPDKIVILGARI
jgi:hypothetical protein